MTDGQTEACETQDSQNGTDSQAGISGETILEEAARITSGPRQRDYDHPLPNHERIARLWNAHLANRGFDVELTAEDVVWMMVGVKQGRDVATPKRDNLVDGCGYLRCLERIRAEKGLAGHRP